MMLGCDAYSAGGFLDSFGTVTIANLPGNDR